jgi:hypothetical protein
MTRFSRAFVRIVQIGCRGHERSGEPLTRKQIVKVLRKSHGVGTIAKALADLTRSGELVNRKDKRGYRLPEWPKRAETPSLFD